MAKKSKEELKYIKELEKLKKDISKEKNKSKKLEKKAKEEKLNPQFENREPQTTYKQDLEIVDRELQEDLVVTPESDSSADSFFRTIINSLHDKKNISTKTEYLNVNENFAGTRLEFYSQFAFMPFLKNFVEIFEEKRVSLERKGRKELIMALQEKQQEFNRERANKFSKLFDMQ